MKPGQTTCVIKKDGKEVGRILATDPNAPTYIESLAKQYDGVSIDYEAYTEQDSITSLLFKR